MLSVSTCVSIFVLLPQAAMVSPYEQEVFASAHTSSSRVKVPGHNHAHYTQVEKEHQLFFIRDLAVYPDPPKLNEHVFTLLDGWIDEKHPGLEDATLKVSGACPGYGEFEKRIADISKPVVRHRTLDGQGYDCGGPLTHEDNEILFDQFWLWGPGNEQIKSNCSLEATARLPDSRVLFSFAMNFTV